MMWHFLYQSCSWQKKAFSWALRRFYVVREFAGILAPFFHVQKIIYTHCSQILSEIVMNSLRTFVDFRLKSAKWRHKNTIKHLAEMNLLFSSPVIIAQRIEIGFEII